MEAGSAVTNAPLLFACSLSLKVVGSAKAI
jgi:hypothetical protein